MATKKTTKGTKETPSWSDVKAQLAGFDRAGLLGLVQDLYAASKDNKFFYTPALAWVMTRWSPTRM